MAGGDCFCCGKRRSVVIASQIDRKTRRSIGFRLCRLRAAVARSRSVAEAAASARGRCKIPPVDASPVHWSPWQCNWFSGGIPSLANLAVVEVEMCDSATVRDAGPWYLKDPSADTRMRVTGHIGAAYPSTSEAPSASTCKSRNMLKTSNPRQRSFLQRCTTFCEIPSEINRSMGNLLFWLGIGAALWVQSSPIYSSSASTAFDRRRYSACPVDQCRSFYFVGQPAMSFM